jgi:hypothetical protein
MKSIILGILVVIQVFLTVSASAIECEGRFFLKEIIQGKATGEFVLMHVRISKNAAKIKYAISETMMGNSDNHYIFFSSLYSDLQKYPNIDEVKFSGKNKVEFRMATGTADSTFVISKSKDGKTTIQVKGLVNGPEALKPDTKIYELVPCNISEAISGALCDGCNEVSFY